MQNLRPLGGGPSGNTWPRCASHTLHVASIRCMPWLVSRWYATTSGVNGAVKLGQPVPLSNFVVE